VLTENISGFSITGSIPVSIPWTSAGEMDVVAAACAHYCSNLSRLPLSSTIYQELLSTGSVSLNVPNGGSIFVAWYLQMDYLHSITLTFTVWTGLTPAPPVLLGLGGPVVVLGALFRRMDGPRIQSSPGE